MQNLRGGKYSRNNLDLASINQAKLRKSIDEVSTGEGRVTRAKLFLILSKLHTSVEYSAEIQHLRALKVLTYRTDLVKELRQKHTSLSQIKVNKKNKTVMQRCPTFTDSFTIYFHELPLVYDGLD